MSAHAVGNDKWAILSHDNEAVLVVVALKPYVGVPSRNGSQSSFCRHLREPAGVTNSTATESSG
jgi:hypothetical protein